MKTTCMTTLAAALLASLCWACGPGSGGETSEGDSGPEGDDSGHEAAPGHDGGAEAAPEASPTTEASSPETGTEADAGGQGTPTGLCCAGGGPELVCTLIDICTPSSTEKWTCSGSTCQVGDTCNLNSLVNPGMLLCTGQVVACNQLAQPCGSATP